MTQKQPPLLQPKANELKRSKKPADDGLTQSERFMKAAQELEADDDPERFAERVRKLAKPASSFKTKRHITGTDK